MKNTLISFHFCPDAKQKLSFMWPNDNDGNNNYSNDKNNSNYDDNN